MAIIVARRTSFRAASTSRLWLTGASMRSRTVPVATAAHGVIVGEKPGLANRQPCRRPLTKWAHESDIGRMLWLDENNAEEYLRTSGAIGPAERVKIEVL